MARILGVNGIHNWSWSTDSFTDKLLDTLDFNHDVVDVKYPRMWALLAYYEKAIQRRADRINECNLPGDVLVAHSFGCLASIYAMRKGARFSKVFFFGAAAEVAIEIPDAFDVLINIHSNTDIALGFGSKLPAHQFGGMGRHGYFGDNPKVVNMPANGFGHNDYTHPSNLCRWMTFIETMIADHSGELPIIENGIIRRYSGNENIKFGRV